MADAGLGGGAAGVVLFLTTPPRGLDARRSKRDVHRVGPVIAETDGAETDGIVSRAIAWLESVQNADGGWGECLHSYGDHALMGLLAYQPADDRAVVRGVTWLVERQDAEGSWNEEEFTGTGFPNHFYLRYDLYRHYFPLMALGRFMSRWQQ